MLQFFSEALCLSWVKTNNIIITIVTIFSSRPWLYIFLLFLLLRFLKLDSPDSKIGPRHDKHLRVLKVILISNIIKVEVSFKDTRISNNDLIIAECRLHLVRADSLKLLDVLFAKFEVMLRRLQDSHLDDLVVL